MENKQTALFEELCGALSNALSNHIDDSVKYSEECLRLAEKQGVITLLHPVKNCFKEEDANRIEKKAQACANSNIRLSYLARYLLYAMQEKEIPACLLKGPSVAVCYPVAELRHFGDVDILLPNVDDLNRTQELLDELECRICKNQDSRHHIEYIHSTGLKLELHIKATRSFEVKFANEYIDKLIASAEERLETVSVYGMEFKVLPAGINALYVLLHILQHYLNSGFGLNLICDYCMYWRKNTNEDLKEEYSQYVKDLGLSNFSDMLSKLSFAYLGGDVNDYPWINIDAKLLDKDEVKNDEIVAAFIEEILASGLYGKNDSSRIVNLKDNSIWGLASQFHHQMKENFPKASKVFIIWPVLWLATLCIFVRNNIFIRKTSTFAVIKTAFQRGSVTKQLELWKR